MRSKTGASSPNRPKGLVLLAAISTIWSLSAVAQSVNVPPDERQAGTTSSTLAAGPSEQQKESNIQPGAAGQAMPRIKSDVNVGSGGPYPAQAAGQAPSKYGAPFENLGAPPGAMPSHPGQKNANARAPTTQAQRAVPDLPAD